MMKKDKDNISLIVLRRKREEVETAEHTDPVQRHCAVISKKIHIAVKIIWS